MIMSVETAVSALHQFSPAFRFSFLCPASKAARGDLFERAVPRLPTTTMAMDERGFEGRKTSSQATVVETKAGRILLVISPCTQ